MSARGRVTSILRPMGGAALTMDDRDQANARSGLKVTRIDPFERSSYLIKAHALNNRPFVALPIVGAYDFMNPPL
jgi:hypothetical protein